MSPAAREALETILKILKSTRNVSDESIRLALTAAYEVGKSDSKPQRKAA